MPWHPHKKPWWKDPDGWGLAAILLIIAAFVWALIVFQDKFDYP